MHLLKSLFGRETQKKEAYLNRLEDLKDDIRRRNDLFDRGPVEGSRGYQDMGQGQWMGIAQDMQAVAPVRPLITQLPAAEVAPPPPPPPPPPATMRAAASKHTPAGPGDAGALAEEQQLREVLARMETPSKLAA